MRQFKAESKRLLDLMINSIYTHKEIFLRELISNASDAMDKLYFLSLTDDSVGLAREDYAIRLTPDKATRTLTISDNGIGMDKADLEANLGVIAASGSLDFRKKAEGAEDIDIIGQFGVGFYSAFMVAKKVTVISRAFGAENAWKWESRGAEGYTVEEAAREAVGTDILLTLKDDTDEEHYSEFLEEYRLAALVKKYSDYIRYPIQMNTTKTRAVEKPEGGEDDKPAYETYTELDTLNSMVPLWKRPKSEVSEEDYAAFYQEKFLDYEAPARVIQSATEGTATYNALLFVPARTPHDYYSKEFEKGLELYASGVLIMQRCADLLPDHFSFVRGLVDSADLSLNISREMLQQDNQLRLIRTSLERRIRGELNAWLTNDREGYEKFFKNFGLQLKVGAYAAYGAEAENLKDLLLFHSAEKGGYQTLKEHRAAMPEGQKYIYYAAGDDAGRLAKLPQAALVRRHGFDLLLLTDEVDEFVLGMLRKYDDVEFRNVSSGDLGLETEAEQEDISRQNEANKDLFAAMKEALAGKVSAVKASGRLAENPVILTAAGGLSLEMERVLNSLPNAERVESTKVLEVNAAHPLFAKLQALQKQNPEELGRYTRILYDQALLIEGLPIEDPAAYSRLVSDLLAATPAAEAPATKAAAKAGKPDKAEKPAAAAKPKKAKKDDKTTQ